MKNLIKKLSQLLGTCVITLALVPTFATLYESYLYDYKGSSVVKLTKTFLQRSGGTGFQVLAPSGKQYTLTNAHICKIADTLVAVNQQGNIEPISVIKIDELHDLCIMEPIKTIKPLKVASSISLHERIWLVGHPALRPLTLQSGHFSGSKEIALLTKCETEKTKKRFMKLTRRYNEIIAAGMPSTLEKRYKELAEITNELLLIRKGVCLNRYQTQYINNISYGGNSGSPVLNKYGNVIGVLFAGRRDQPTASYTVPLADIKRFLKDK